MSPSGNAQLYAGARATSRDMELVRALRKQNEKLRLVLAVLGNRFEATRNPDMSDRLVLAQARALLEEVGEM